MSQRENQVAIGYCTNVHAGTDLDSICVNLAQHAEAVRAQLNLASLPVGLWLPDSVARELEQADRLTRLAKALTDHSLIPYTINGFPFGNFHQPVVKHAVYEPTWWQQERVDYTLRLARHLAALLSAGQSGTISTLPLGWPHPGVGDDERRRAAVCLAEVGRELDSLADETGRSISICLEPEPGCVLQTSGDVIEFFERFLRPAARKTSDTSLAHLGVCHDVCHAVVMREDQADVIARYVDAGIPINKVQVSSCIQVDFNSMDRETKSSAFQQLIAFAEDRYLHQTTVSRDEQTVFFADLPEAIAASRLAGEPTGDWRTHFHVPVYLERFGELSTSKDAIIRCMMALREHALTPDLEVETYAWGVLPQELKTRTLAEGIARELEWFSLMCDAAF